MMKRIFKVLGGVLLLWQPVASAVEIDVLGLFTDAAMLSIDGRQQMLRKGERSTEGVLLLSSNSREAVIQLGDVSHTLNLSSKIGTSYQQAEAAKVSIILNPIGQYKTSGTINGRRVELLVDTGANVIAMSEGHARTLGIDMSEGKQMRATTASGVTESRGVVLETVQIGGIKVNNVQAAVMKGEFPQDILLGMSFLRAVEMSENQGIMQLTAKF